MTIINTNSIAGINSITAQESQPFSVYNSNGNIGLTVDSSGNITIPGITSAQDIISNNINNTGIITCSSLSSNDMNVTGIITASSFVGTATNAINSNVSTSVIGGISSVTQIRVTGISTFLNGPVLIGTASTTGTNSQPLQVIGKAYISDNTGIGTTNPTSTLHVIGDANIIGSVSDSYGNVRSRPQNSKTSSYILIASDSGKHISITTGGVTVPSGVFNIGDTIIIYNNSSANQTITQGGSVTMYLSGTATTGNRTLAQRGVCTILCVAVNNFVIYGHGLS